MNFLLLISIFWRNSNLHGDYRHHKSLPGFNSRSRKNINPIKTKAIQEPVLAEGQGVYSLKQDLEFINRNFLMYIPKGYNNSKRNSWPAIIFLHGRNEWGKDINLVKKHGLPKILNGAKNLNFLVISPQCPPKTIWNHSDKLHEFLWEMIERFKIDPRQVYLTGISSGGSASWFWAKDYPSDFAALVPVSGACFTDVSGSLQNFPVWIFHGLKDNTVKIHEDSVTYKSLSGNPDRVRFTVFPKGGHDIWDQTYLKPELYSWLLKFKNP